MNHSSISDILFKIFKLNCSNKSHKTLDSKIQIYPFSTMSERVARHNHKLYMILTMFEKGTINGGQQKCNAVPPMQYASNAHYL